MSVLQAAREPARGTRAGEKKQVKRLILADKLRAEGIEELRRAKGIIVEDLAGVPREELLRALPGAAGLIVRSGTQADAELLEAADSLEVIGRAGVGLDNIDVQVATRRGIAVLNAPAGNSISTAELAFGLMLAVARRIPEADRSIREGRWDRAALRGVQIQGKVLGVVGAGRIGARVIRRARAFGMEVLVSDPFLTEERAAALHAERLDLAELLARADFVTLHVPLTDATRGLIGADQLAMMKPDAFLINAARGGLVDGEALAAALREERLAGAALDVVAEEPLPADHPLRDTPRLVMTPHLGSVTAEAQRDVAIEIARAVCDALLGEDLHAAVNVPHVGSEHRKRFAPVIELTRRLGVLMAELAIEPCRRLEVRYAGPYGDALHLLAAAALAGFLKNRVDRQINLVNSLLVARERGIDVSRVALGERAAYSNYVELFAVDGEEHVVGGALLGAGHARLVRIGDFHVDTVPAGTLLLIRNRDVPGVIGEVGTRLGAAGINIAGYHQARREAGGDALAVLTVDEVLPAKLLEELRSLSRVTEVRQVSL